MLIATLIIRPLVLALTLDLTGLSTIIDTTIIDIIIIMMAVTIDIITIITIAVIGFFRVAGVALVTALHTNMAPTSGRT